MGTGGLCDMLGIGRDASVDEIRKAFCMIAGTQLRLGGKGALTPDGTRQDLVVEVGITVPATLDEELLALAQALRAKASDGEGPVGCA